MPATEQSRRLLLKKFFLLAKTFFSGGAKRQARLWLAALLGLCVAVGVVQVFLSYAMRDVITALAQRDHAGWVRGLWKFVAICFVSVPVGVFYRYSQERLWLTWRRWLTQHLITRYFFNRACYRIRASESVVMGLLAVVPVLGAFVVCIPAAILLLLEGSWGKALILTVWGGVVVGGIDNVLYPMLVGSRLKMHTVLAFISVVGGLMVFDPTGLVLGPVALTITTEILAIWRRRAVDPATPT